MKSTNKAPSIEGARILPIADYFKIRIRDFDHRFPDVPNPGITAPINRDSLTYLIGQNLDCSLQDCSLHLLPLLSSSSRSLIS